jgi:hypothetical protein
MLHWDAILYTAIHLFPKTSSLAQWMLTSHTAVGRMWTCGRFKTCLQPSKNLLYHLRHFHVAGSLPHIVHITYKEYLLVLLSLVARNLMIQCCSTLFYIRSDKVWCHFVAALNAQKQGSMADCQAVSAVLPPNDHNSVIFLVHMFFFWGGGDKVKSRLTLIHPHTTQDWRRAAKGELETLLICTINIKLVMSIDIYTVHILNLYGQSVLMFQGLMVTLRFHNISDKVSTRWHEKLLVQATESLTGSWCQVGLNVPPS